MRGLLVNVNTCTVIFILVQIINVMVFPIFAEQEFSAIETNKVTLAINLRLTVMVINEHLKWSRKNICAFKNNHKIIKVYIYIYLTLVIFAECATCYAPLASASWTGEV